jgi:ubiquinone/menaquinone biosynthesis C-methylase UbiE
MSEVTQPVAFRVEDGAEQDFQQLITVLDMQAALAGVWRMRAWGLEVLDPRPGSCAIDIGSGTGSEVLAMADLVGPTGDAIGVEPNSGLRAEAARRAAGSTARFVDGSAHSLPFADSTVDIVRCERVWQHLDQPALAAMEIARVLRPGGRALVIDTDWATAIAHPGDPSVVAAVHQFWMTRFANPTSGRRLPGLLTAAGLTIADQGSQALLQPPTALAGLVKMTITEATAANAISASHGDQLLADLQAGAALGDFHFSVTMFGVLAVKPDTAPGGDRTGRG